MIPHEAQLAGMYAPSTCLPVNNKVDALRDAEYTHTDPLSTQPSFPAL